MKSTQFASLIGLAGAALTATYLVTGHRHDQRLDQAQEHHEEWRTIASSAQHRDLIDTFLQDPDGVLVMAGDESRTEQTRSDMVCNSQFSYLTMLWCTGQITAEHLRDQARVLMGLRAFHAYWERHGRARWDDTARLRQFSTVMERAYQAQAQAQAERLKDPVLDAESTTS
ncbi:DUF6082 family protein [Streptomyces sp. NPDC047046]|uniref:DUF6082 family protein n=1 Tax=Streptomyces sp. NPDC047046 TaxID=3155378 RepID=UPI0033CB26D9